ncbi:PPR superfamily protein, putative [Medicago truncatula]|uniref:PPR superfamily protein, putative n=1 Tax=Medicago truncatula TaxID=3880 RepID=A0A072U800_MEDTR|nr:PPR superfamily protein, putative [Medicago truncatula]
MDIPHDLRNGDFEETMNLLTCIMDQEGTMAIEFSFVVLLNACAGIAALRHGDLLQARVEKLGFKNRVIVGNGLEHIACVVAVLYRDGLLDEAENFMKTTQVKWDVVS